MTKLGVNVDHVANIRQARRTDEPDPVIAAGIVQLAGADGITVHLREDRRHIQERDLRLMRQIVTTKLNLEMADSREIIDIALEVRPEQVTLVPEKREEVTTEGGLDVASRIDHLAPVVEELHNAGISVSMFIDHDAEQIHASAAAGADGVEIHTGLYANAGNPAEADMLVAQIAAAAELALGMGLAAYAGHGLTYNNVVPIARIGAVTELNIGHSIVSRSVFAGLDGAVREMIALIRDFS